MNVWDTLKQEHLWLKLSYDPMLELYTASVFDADGVEGLVCSFNQDNAVKQAIVHQQANRRQYDAHHGQPGGDGARDGG